MAFFTSSLQICIQNQNVQLSVETKEALSLITTEVYAKDPLLFNLYLNEIPHILDYSHDTDPIVLPNGLPLNCLFYADDLVLISKSACGLQKHAN